MKELKIAMTKFLKIEKIDPSTIYIIKFRNENIKIIRDSNKYKLYYDIVINNTPLSTGNANTKEVFKFIKRRYKILK